MPLTSQQDIPERPKNQEPWSIKQLFSFPHITAPLAKAFVNPFDILLGFMVLIDGAVELFGRHASWQFWGLTVLLLACTLFERYYRAPEPLPTKKK